MPIYGSALYGSAVYDGAPAPGSPLALRRAIYGGWAPWLPANIITWRRKCIRLYAVDPVTLAWSGSPLVGITNACTRSLDTRDSLIMSDTLKVQLADRDGIYLPGGAQEDVFAPNALIGLEVTVTTPAGSLTSRPNLYRVTTGLSQDLDRWGRTVFNTGATDWVHSALDQFFPTLAGDTPWGPLPTMLTIAGETLPLVSLGALSQAFALTQWAIAQGAPVPPVILSDPGSYGSMLTVMLYMFTNGHLTVDASTPPGYPFPTGLAYTKYFTDPLAAKGGNVTWRELLTYLVMNIPARLSFTETGDVAVFGAVERRDSGYLVSCDAGFAGDFPVPWENVRRAVQRTPFSAVTIWNTYLNDMHPPQPYMERVASATSTALRNPHIAPIGKTESIINQYADAAAIPGAIAGDVPGSIAARRLRDYLGPADTLTLQTDSACPPPAAGEEVTVVLPDEQIIGRWAFTGASIPLNVGAASWTLQWRDDNPGFRRAEG